MYAKRTSRALDPDGSLSLRVLLSKALGWSVWSAVEIIDSGALELWKLDTSFSLCVTFRNPLILTPEATGARQPIFMTYFI